MAGTSPAMTLLEVRPKPLHLARPAISVRGSVPQTRPFTGNSMAKWLLILVLPIALAGCVTEQNSMLPMTLGPSDTDQATCLTYGDTPAYGCKTPAALSSTQETK